MPRRVIKQPNGKYALFSSVSDYLVWYNADDAQALELLTAEFMRDDAERMLDNARRDLLPFPPTRDGEREGRGRDRWNYDVPMMVARHMDDPDVPRILRECGMTQEEIDIWIAELTEAEDAWQRGEN